MPRLGPLCRVFTHVQHENGENHSNSAKHGFEVAKIGSVSTRIETSAVSVEFLFRQLSQRFIFPAMPNFPWYTQAIGVSAPCEPEYPDLVD